MRGPPDRSRSSGRAACHGSQAARSVLVLAEVGTVRYGFVSHRPPGPVVAPVSPLAGHVRAAARQHEQRGRRCGALAARARGERPRWACCRE
jgi:hypothetical protein